MANKNKRSNQKSLCEKSMKIVVNILKISSLSLATMSLGSPSGNGKLKSEVTEITFVTKNSGQSRLKEPENSLKTSSYLLNPDQEKASSYVIHNEMNVDGKASDYIQRFHAKNRAHSSNLKASFLIIPPPPLIK
ncbi:hypothetical protein ACHQM5_005954 [Ranunculus cassubicifolius]